MIYKFKYNSYIIINKNHVIISFISTFILISFFLFFLHPSLPYLSIFTFLINGIIIVILLYIKTLIVTNTKPINLTGVEILCHTSHPAINEIIHTTMVRIASNVALLDEFTCYVTSIPEKLNTRTNIRYTKCNTNNGGECLNLYAHATVSSIFGLGTAFVNGSSTKLVIGNNITEYIKIPHIPSIPTPILEFTYILRKNISSVTHHSAANILPTIIIIIPSTGFLAGASDSSLNPIAE